MNRSRCDGFKKTSKKMLSQPECDALLNVLHVFDPDFKGVSDQKASAIGAFMQHAASLDTIDNRELRLFQLASLDNGTAAAAAYVDSDDDASEDVDADNAADDDAADDDAADDADDAAADDECEGDDDEGDVVVGLEEPYDDNWASK